MMNYPSPEEIEELLKLDEKVYEEKWKEYWENKCQENYLDLNSA